MASLLSNNASASLRTSSLAGRRIQGKVRVVRMQPAVPRRSVCLSGQSEQEQPQPLGRVVASAALCVALLQAPLPVSAGEVYEGMFAMQNSKEIADVGQSMNVSQNKINKVVSFLSTCAADASCNDDLAKLRDDMQSAVRNSQVAIRSAGKNAEYDSKAVDLMFIADEFDCIEIRRDKSTAFLVNQFGAAKVGAGVLGADHTQGRALCSKEYDDLFGKGPKTSVLAKEALPTISKAADIIAELKAALV